jgi:hypothetical protein
MKIERHWRREIAGWTVTVLALLALQYATVHGYDFGPVAHDTNPTTGPLERLVVTLAPVTILPLGPIARHSVWTGGTRWTGRVMRMLPRFHNYDADCLVFAAVNTVAWVLGTAVFLAAVRAEPQWGPPRWSEVWVSCFTRPSCDSS